MNKFRNNLHLAFFDPENEFANQRREYYDRVSNPEEQELEQEVHEETQEVKEDVVQNPEFSNVAGNVVSEASSRYTDMEQLKRDRARFNERLRSKSSNGEEYVKVWEKKIRDGFNHLIKSLEENNYFKDCKDDEAKTQKIADIMVRYSKEVHSQYEEYIWRGGNKTFNSVKDSIFGPNAEEYPAEKIYRELTGATNISKVERRHTEGYNADIIDWTGIEDGGDIDMSERQNRNFLSDDLPEYLWNIRKTPGIVNAFKWLPIFSAKEDRPSKVDRKAIKQFLKVSSKTEVEGNKDKAVALMEVFHDSSLNTNSGEDDYKAVLAKHGVKVEDKYIDDIVKAGSFYINTQSDNNSTRDQHAIYLSVLKIVESEGGVDNAVKKFKTIVEQAEKDKKVEKKEGYENGEKLGSTNPELYEIAKNLKITDFTSATRLSEKTSEYFANTPVEKILANLNNDRTIDARDNVVGGSKTGVQFLEIFKQVGKEKALPNLVERAKLLNKTLGVGLPDALFNADTIEEDIKGGHTGLILLLQDIISKPGEDLYTLLSGHSENPFEGLDLAAEKASADAVAAEMVGKMNLEALKKDGLTLPTPESMQSGLSTALYTEYKRGIGLGGKMSFDQWIKGVEMNTGFQVRDDGTVMVGLGLDYHKKFNLGKGWSTTPELSAGAFIPLGMGKPELSGSVGLNDEVAKERITKNGIKQHLGIQGGVTLMPAGVLVISTGFNWSENKLDGIDTREQQMKGELISRVMTPVLEDVAKTLASKGKTKLDFNDPEVVNVVRQSILVKAKDEKVPSDKQEMVTDAVMRLLLNYNNADLTQEGVKDLIAQGVAEQYAMAWAEDRKAHITDKAYLSGANLGVFWVVGSPLVGIYAGIKFTKHDLDGYGDKYGRERELDSEYQGKWTETLLKSFNQQLGLSGDKEIKLENGFIVIPKSIAHRVNVNTKMEGLMKKDENGNILLHSQTPMAADIKRGAATQGAELIIGGRKGGQYVKLDTLGDERFTEEINENDVLELGEGISSYNLDVLNKALEELKKKFPVGDSIQDLDFSMFSNVQDLIDKLNALDKTKKAKLSLITNEKGEIEVQDPVEGEPGRGLEIEYQARFEMIDYQAREVATAVYAEALRVNNPRILNAVKHDKPKHWPEYDPFNAAMQSKDYQAAREAIKPIFAKLDKQIAGAKFTEIGQKLDEIQDNVALGQALMSINNIFARSVKVVGGSSEYKFTTSMASIIKEREGQISRTIKNYNGENITPEVKAGYQSLIDASAKYREKSKIFDNKKSAPAMALNNTVGFNLGDKTNPENPLFNPEIYNPTVELKELENYGFGSEQRNALHERAMRLFAGNEALINPILKYLGLEGQEVQIKEFNSDGEKGKLTLDIGGKIITLNAGMKFGYFTQCVNHTVILNDISAETEDGTSVTFNSGVWEGGRYKEGNKSTIVSTTEVGISGSLIVHDGRKPKKTNQPPEDDPSSQPGSNPTNTPDDVTTEPTERTTDIPTDPETPTTPKTPTTPDYSDFTSNDEDGI